MKQGANIAQIRKYYKKKGLILRVYHRPDGTVKYTLRKNTYRKEVLE